MYLFSFFIFVSVLLKQEGVAAEAISLAGTMKLGRLIVLYDDNNIQIDGHTELAFTEDVPARFAAMGWHVQTVADGNHDLPAMFAAIDAAKAESDRPSIIVLKTTIGYAAAKEGTEEVHGSPLGAKDIAAVKEKFGFNPAEYV